MILDKRDQEFFYEGTKYYVGQQIVGTKASEYEGLFGTITEIRDGDDKDTDNETPDIYCSFEAPDMPCDVERVEKIFSDLYDEPKKIEDIILDLVIMAPEMIKPLENPFPKEKVYLVIEDWAHDDNRGTSYLVTTSLEEAKKQMRLIFKRELEEGFLGDQLKGNERFIVDSEDRCYDAYEDGYADAEHYTLYIEEYSMQMDCNFIERASKLHRDTTRFEDFFSHLMEMPKYAHLTNEDLKKLARDPELLFRIQKALEQNDSYWEAYWLSMSDVADKMLKEQWTGMDLHKRAKCGIICISGIEKGYHNGKGQVQRRNEVANRQVRA